MKSLIRKIRDWRIYIIATILVTLLFSVVGFYFSYKLKDYLYTQLVNEAVYTSNINRFTISSINRSIHHIEDLLVEKLELAGRSIIDKTSTHEDAEIINWVQEHYGIDEINWFSREGAVLYSTEDHEGMVMDPDHAVWLLLDNSVNYFVEDIRKDIMSERYFLLLYMKVNDGSVIQLSIDAERLYELTDQYSFENHLQEILKDTRIQTTLVHMEYEEHSKIYGFGEGSRHLTSAQWDRIINQVHDHRITTIDNESVLEVYIPIEEDNVAIGTYFVVYSLSEIEAFGALTTSVLIVLLIMVILITAILLILLYKQDREFEEKSIRDEGTGLYNRMHLIQKYNDYKGAPEGNHFNAVVYLIKNLKRLQLVNSQEAILKQVRVFSEALERHCESSEIYRYSDDVFLVVYQNQQVVDIIRRINNLFENIESELDLKAGIIQESDAFSNLEDVLRSIDLTTVRLHDEKEARYVLMNEAIQDEILLNQRLELDLRRLSATGFGDELYVVFQPQIDIMNNKVIGFETLTRWQHPELGLIAPHIIFSIAERSDFDVTLSRWVLTETLQFIKKLDEAGLHDLIVSFNASISVIEKKGFVHNLIALLAYEELPPSRLGVEVTETRIDTVSGMLSEIIKELSSYGITVSIDDYGRGYSSLIRLKSLDVDVVKIDKSFIDDIGRDERFIASIVEMAKSLNLKLVAEGVETEEQLNWLRNNECEVVQGFYFSKPITIEEAIEFTINFNKKQRSQTT
ncbi:MAG TPA: GGDEF domain-containing phosphodiesterase [Erysipelothrix sp.]|nr:GGDEF domain-containing phosphodiesterase [Erysipelothrix sp.]